MGVGQTTCRLGSRDLERCHIDSTQPAEQGELGRASGGSHRRPDGAEGHGPTGVSTRPGVCEERSRAPGH